MKVNREDNYPTIKTLAETVPPPIIDEASGSVTYYGWAPLKTPENGTGWKIMKVSKTGNVTKSEFPNADNTYNFIWADRASYVYSR